MCKIGKLKKTKERKYWDSPAKRDHTSFDFASIEVYVMMITRSQALTSIDEHPALLYTFSCSVELVSLRVHHREHELGERILLVRHGEIPGHRIVILLAGYK